MARKEQFTKEYIINGGVEFVRQNGIEQLNVRNLAQFMKCSTQPIFRNYTNIEEYKLDLKKALHNRYKNYIYENTDKKNYLFTTCYSYALFANVEPNIFRALFITSLAGSRTVDEVIISSRNQETINYAVNEYNIPKESAERLYRDIRFYTHGIATQLSCGSIILTEEELHNLIEETIEKLK